LQIIYLEDNKRIGVADGSSKQTRKAYGEYQGLFQQLTLLSPSTDVGVGIHGKWLYYDNAG
jgi:hypothetical protein